MTAMLGTTDVLAKDPLLDLDGHCGCPEWTLARFAQAVYPEGTIEDGVVA
jgi:hypothetical protein